MENNKLKVGIVGVGGIARGSHLPAWIQNPNVEIVALCDIVIEKAKKAAEKYDIKQVFENYEDMLAIDEIDVIDICTPNYLHSIVAVKALEKGKHVLCEKPDAISPEEASKMKEASEKNDKMLMVVRNNRFADYSQYLKKYIEDGNLGEIYVAKCGWVRRRGIPGKGGWFTTKSQSGGGPLIDLGVHMIDLAIWLMGNPKPISVVGSTYCMFADSSTTPDSEDAKFGEKKDDGIFDVEDLAMGFIRFDNGTTMSFEFSWASNIKEACSYVELLGTDQGAIWKSLDPRLKIFGEKNGETVDIYPNISSKGNVPDHAKNINHFVDCLVNGTKPIFTPEQGVDMIKILDAIYRSAKEKREIVL